jgi:predicted transcriptional regulator
MLDTTIDKIMSENVVKLNDDIKVGFAAHVLYRHKINGLLIMDRNDPDKLAGVFTMTDLLNIMALACESSEDTAGELEKASQIDIADLMSGELFTMQVDNTVRDAIEMMHANGVHTLPVFDGDKLVGVIGRHDVLNITLNYWE